MSKISDLRASHAAAGQRYKAAVDELHRAYVELGALDHMCAFAAGEQHVATFHNAPNPWGFVHPIFLPYDDHVRALTNWFDEIAARRNAYIKENHAIAEGPK
jgi:hypothetical protein